MLYVSDIQTTAPRAFQTPLQRKTYEALASMGIPYERVETEEVITMEDCKAINAKLRMKMVKTLFLCNRQQRDFYLFISPGDKPFRSKDFSAALSVPRVSFAPANLMEQKLGTRIGAATVFSALLDSASDTRIVFDKAVLDEPWYGCSDGTTTGYLKIETKRILRTLLPRAGREAEIIEV